MATAAPFQQQHREGFSRAAGDRVERPRSRRPASERRPDHRPTEHEEARKRRTETKHRMRGKQGDCRGKLIPTNASDHPIVVCQLSPAREHPRAVASCEEVEDSRASTGPGSPIRMDSSV